MGLHSPKQAATHASRRPPGIAEAQRLGRSFPQIQINPFVEGYGVAVATSLPIAGHAGLHQQPLTLIVVVSCYLVRQRRARTHDAHPFCQDEKTRLRRHFMREAALDADFEDTF